MKFTAKSVLFAFVVLMKFGNYYNVPYRSPQQGTLQQECSTDLVYIDEEKKKCLANNVNEHFHCLKLINGSFDAYVEICRHSILVPAGNYPVFNEGKNKIEYLPCPDGTYNPEINKSSNELRFFKCKEKTHPNYKAGQVECGTPSTKENSLFRCDHTRYFRFDDELMTKCSPPPVFCVAESKCNNTTHELTAEYQCVKKCKEGYERKETPPYNCTASNHISFSTKRVTISSSSKKNEINTTQPTQSDGDDIKRGAIIAAITLGCILFVVIVVVCWCSRKKIRSFLGIVAVCLYFRKEIRSLSDIELLQREEATNEADDTEEERSEANDEDDTQEQRSEENDEGNEARNKSDDTQEKRPKANDEGSEEEILIEGEEIDFVSYYVPINNIYTDNGQAQQREQSDRKVKLKIKPDGPLIIGKEGSVTLICNDQERNNVTWFDASTDEPLEPQQGKYEMEKNKLKIYLMVFEEVNEKEYYCARRGGESDISNVVKVKALHMTTLAEKDKNEWLFVLDYISRLCPLDGIKRVARMLEVQDSDIDNINQTYHEAREKMFQMLLRWFKNVGNIATPFQTLADTLEKAGLKRFAEKIFCKAAFQCDENIDTRNLTEIDIFTISKKLTKDQRLSLAHFFGFLPISKDSEDILYQCLHQRLIKNRRDLCNGLVYIQEKNVIEDMKRQWKI